MNGFIDLFLSPQSLPFAVALAVVALLFLIEILTALAGGSLLGAGSEGADVDADLDFDFSADIDAGLDIGSIDFDGAEMAIDGTGMDAAEPTFGVMDWIGARGVPFLVWLVTFLTMFGLCGLILQSALASTLGFSLPAVIAVAIVLFPAAGITRFIAGWVGVLVPKTETTAIRARHLGGCHGTITQGTASRGKPAEAKVKDRHGNVHYLRVEPLRTDTTFALGEMVILIRKRGNTFFVI